MRVQARRHREVISAHKVQLLNSASRQLHCCKYNSAKSFLRDSELAKGPGGESVMHGKRVQLSEIEFCRLAAKPPEFDQRVLQIQQACVIAF